MVGLFWIDAESVHLGTPSATTVSDVLLTPESLRVVGPEPGEWLWSDVTAIEVVGAPVRSTGVRWAGRAASVAAAALDVWVPGSPDEMTVAVSSGGDRVETTVLSGAAGAYSRREVDLSRALLARFVDGTSSPAVLSDWWTSADPGALRSRGREAVLEEWLAAQ
ncbi:hypothetical protein [Streptomyces violascens]|uniref:Uncharacterized protein n=1 Tax=Streptomyces violascens TaxID=67381 RepID=A0ABQ3QUL1_9ACTN|nr:hypothetical protein [Streptomyces violascens]GGU05635.1 hypothetical protein GCM10010289_28250 [Streptomyces violascens]GHI40973.1 hypothetical protein Sviol_53810 [Streptomyces violascens]